MRASLVAKTCAPRLRLSGRFPVDIEDRPSLLVFSFRFQIPVAEFASTVYLGVWLSSPTCLFPPEPGLCGTSAATLSNYTLRIERHVIKRMGEGFVQRGYSRQHTSVELCMFHYVKHS